MACHDCSTVPETPEKHSYLVHLVDDATGRYGRCVVQSECSHDMQEWATALASTASLMVVDPDNDETFSMDRPNVVHVDVKAAAHIPTVDAQLS